jgi:hypothetical protein
MWYETPRKLSSRKFYSLNGWKRCFSLELKIFRQMPIASVRLGFSLTVTWHTWLSGWLPLQDPKQFSSFGSFHIHLISLSLWMYAASVCSRSWIWKNKNVKENLKDLSSTARILQSHNYSYGSMESKSRLISSPFGWSPSSSYYQPHRTSGPNQFPRYVPWRIGFPRADWSSGISREASSTATANPGSDRGCSEFEGIRWQNEWCLSFVWPPRSRGIIRRWKRDRRVNSPILIGPLFKRYRLYLKYIDFLSIFC